MKFWIDSDSETNNVTCITNTTILVASCDKEHLETTRQHLENKKEPSEIFGGDDIQSVPLIQIQTVTSRSTDTEIDINYKAKNDIEDISLDFGSDDKKSEALKVLSILLPDTLDKSIYQQSRPVAAIAPLITLLSMSVISFLFIDKFRWAVVVIGGIGVLASAYMTFSRFTTPPEITRWKLKGKYTRKAIGHIKTGFSYLVAAVIVIGLWAKFPDSYGEKSLYAQMQDDELSADDVQQYLKRGADINFVDKEGETPLSLAIGWEETALAIALINAGADLNSVESQEQAPLYIAIYNASDITLIKALLNKGADTQLTIDGLSLIEYSREAGQEDIALLLSQHQSSL